MRLLSLTEVRCAAFPSTTILFGLATKSEPRKGSNSFSTRSTDCNCISDPSFGLEEQAPIGSSPPVVTESTAPLEEWVARVVRLVFCPEYTGVYRSIPENQRETTFSQSYPLAPR